MERKVNEGMARSKENPVPPPKFYKLSDVADVTQHCYRTVHRAAQAGKIRTVTFGGSKRVPADEFEKLMKRGW